MTVPLVKLGTKIPLGTSGDIGRRDREAARLESGSELPERTHPVLTTQSATAASLDEGSRSKSQL